jgi:predicted oxidoreductase
MRGGGMNKEQLSERIAELYNVDAKISSSYDNRYLENGHYQYEEIFTETWLIDDTARMFELAVRHGISVDADNREASTAYIKVKGYIKHSIDAIHANHANKLEATLYAIGMALVKKAEI